MPRHLPRLHKTMRPVVMVCASGSQAELPPLRRFKWECTALPGSPARVLDDIRGTLVPDECKLARWGPSGAPSKCAGNHDPSLVRCAGCPEGSFTVDDSMCHECARAGGSVRVVVLILICVVGLVGITVAANKKVFIQPKLMRVDILIRALRYLRIIEELVGRLV